MSAFFWINPGIVVGCASLFGCLYFLCVCVDDAKTLLAYWQRHSAATQTCQTWSEEVLTTPPFSLFYRRTIKAMCGPGLPGDRLLPLLPSPQQAD